MELLVMQQPVQAGSAAASPAPGQGSSNSSGRVCTHKQQQGRHGR
jgi:hypothetical protein